MVRPPVDYAFDDDVVSVRSETVTKAGRTVALEPKAFELLVVLIENRGALVA